MGRCLRPQWHARRGNRRLCRRAWLEGRPAESLEAAGACGRGSGSARDLRCGPRWLGWQRVHCPWPAARPLGGHLEDHWEDQGFYSAAGSREYPRGEL